LEGNEWTIQSLGELGTHLAQYAKDKLGRPLPLGYGYAYTAMAVRAYPKMIEYKALGPTGETFSGGLAGGGDADMEETARWHHEQKWWQIFAIDEHVLEHGPISKIEEAMKKHTLDHKHMPGFAPGLVPAYWTPQAHVEAAIETCKKYGRYE